MYKRQYEYRAVLEAGIVRAACERGTDEELASLRAFVERSRDVPEDSDATRLLELDEAFHPVSYTHLDVYKRQPRQ